MLQVPGLEWSLPANDMDFSNVALDTPDASRPRIATVQTVPCGRTVHRYLQIAQNLNVLKCELKVWQPVGASLLTSPARS